MSDEKPNPFNIIKHRGDPNTASFLGVKVYRTDHIFCEGHGIVQCVPYDNNFVFEVPKSRFYIGMWSYWCTCGSMAGIANPEDLNQKMIVCLFYHQRLHADGYGYHQQTVINIRDFDQIAGQTIELPKGKRWLI